MAKEYASRGASFVFLYTREAHPGGKYTHHSTLEQKLSHARDMVVQWSIERTMLVDDLEGTVHRAYGALPNMTYIVGAGGRVQYRADWTDPRTIGTALEQLAYGQERRRSGARVTPYYVEWQPTRVNDREPFVEGLLRDVGPSAVEEYIAAVAHTQGDGAASALRAWWALRQDGLSPPSLRQAQDRPNLPPQGGRDKATSEPHPSPCILVWCVTITSLRWIGVRQTDYS